MSYGKFLSKHVLPQTRRSPNVCSMLGQRRRRWANTEPTLAERLVFAGTLIFILPSQQTRDVGPMLVHCCAAVVDREPTVNQHWANVLCLLGG